jgi:RNA polymerase sigma-70 factor (ECF subfamily)
MTPTRRPERDDDQHLSAIIDERRRLTNLAYRMLGSLADAEDVLQETYARWYAMEPHEREAIDSPAAWLTTVASRLCLDQLRSARYKREKYVGDWIPEPVPDLEEWSAGSLDDPNLDPADRITLDESINMAFLVVLESMTPAERVAFILHDVFRYPYAEIAEVVGRSPGACRQLAASARRRLDSSAPRTKSRDLSAGIVRKVKSAWEAKDIKALVELLDPEATVVVDGGGLVSAFPEPIRGREQVARALVELLERAPGLSFAERTVNGEPGLIAVMEGATVAVMAVDVVDGRIKHIWSVRNPEKLRPWSAG